MARVRNIGRDPIVAAARTVLQGRGPEAVTIKAVAEQADVTQGTVYYYFKTKDDLIVELIRTSVDEQMERFDEAFASAHDTATRIERTLDAVKEVFLKDDAFQRRFFGLIAKGLADERSAREVRQIMDRVSANIDRHLQAAMGGGAAYPASIAHLGRILRAAFDGLALQSLFDRDMDIDAIFDSLKRIVMALYDGAQTG